MNLSIHTHGLPTDATLRDYIEKKLMVAFDHNLRHVDQFRIVIENVNGPRGGRDKRGQVVVNLNHHSAPIVATSRDFTVQGCLNQVIRRASRALTKHMEHLQRHRDKLKPVEA